MPRDTTRLGRLASHRRRQILKATGAVGIAGLAGCLGDDDDDDPGDDTDDEDGVANGDDDDGDDQPEDEDETLTMGTAAEVSANFVMMNNLGGAVNENTDDVHMDVRPSDSMAANVGHLERDEADIGLIENTTAHDVREGIEPFQDVDVDLRMIAHGSTTDWFLFTEDPDIASLSDIQPETAVAPGPAGSRVTEMIRRVLELRDIDYDEQPTGYGDMGAGIAEGRFDVALAANLNVLIEPTNPGWVDEIVGTVDARILGIDDDHFDDINDTPGMSSFEFEPADTDDWEFIPEPAARSMSQVTWIYGTDETPYDPVYAMLETMWEIRDELSEWHDVLGRYESDDHWANEPHEGFEYHPASEDFFEEHGLI